MITCNKALSWMDQYIENLLEGKRLKSMQEHISSCSSCREKAKELDRLRNILGNLHSPRPPKGFLDRFEQEFSQRLMLKPESQSRITKIALFGVRLAGIAASFFILFFSIEIILSVLTASGPRRKSDAEKYIQITDIVRELEKRYPFPVKEEESLSHSRQTNRGFLENFNKNN